MRPSHVPGVPGSYFEAFVVAALLGAVVLLLVFAMPAH